MSPTTKKLVRFAEQPATAVGTGAGPSDSEDSDEYYERMESPPPPPLSRCRYQNVIKVSFTASMKWRVQLKKHLTGKECFFNLG